LGIGVGLTITLIFPLTLQPSSVAVTVYSVVVVGLATGLGSEELFNVVAGVQVKTFALDAATSCADPPSQIVVSFPFENVRLLFNPTVTFFVMMQLF
jgi:hypothetical protein